MGEILFPLDILGKRMVDWVVRTAGSRLDERCRPPLVSTHGLEQHAHLSSRTRRRGLPRRRVLLRVLLRLLRRTVSGRQITAGDGGRALKPEQQRPRKQISSGRSPERPFHFAESL